MPKAYRYVKNDKGEYECNPRAFSRFQNLMGIAAALSVTSLPVILMENIWWDKWPTEKLLGTAVVIIGTVFFIFRTTLFDKEIRADGIKILQWKEEYRLVEEYDEEENKEDGK